MAWRKGCPPLQNGKPPSLRGKAAATGGPQPRRWVRLRSSRTCPRSRRYRSIKARQGWGGFGRGWGRRRARPAQEGNQTIAVEAAQGEDQERVAVKLLADQVINRRDMFTRVGIIGARATGLEVAELAREQRKISLLERLLDIGRHLPREQFRREDRLLRQQPGQAFPIGGGNRLDLDRDLIRLRPRPLHLGLDLSLADVDFQHLSAPSIRPTSGQSPTDVERLQDRDPPFGPPALAKLPLLGLSLDAALRGARLRGLESVPIVPH